MPSTVSTRNPLIRNYRAALSLLLFYPFYGFCIGIFLCRGSYGLWDNYPFVQTLVGNDHITNFIFSALLVLGAAGIAAGFRQYRLAGLAAVAAIALNVVVESGTGLSNVADPWDALSGMLGVTAATAIIWMLAKLSGRQTTAPVPIRATIAALVLFISNLATCMALFLYGDYLGFIPLQYSLSVSLNGALALTSAGYFVARQNFRAAKLVALTALLTSLLANLERHADPVFIALDLLTAGIGVAGAIGTIALIQKISRSKRSK